MFECVLSLYDSQISKTVKRTYLVDALSFTEAEANMTKFMVEWEELESFFIISLKQVKYDDFISPIAVDGEEEDFNWYECKVRVESLSGDKETVMKFLNYAEDTRQALVAMKEYLADWEEGYKIASIQEKELCNIVIRKQCCEECDVCISKVRILSYHEQLEIEERGVKFDSLENMNKVLLEQLGAIHQTKTKFTIEVKASEDFKNLLGKRIGHKVVRKFKEDFVDKDTGEVVSVDRGETVVNIGEEITEETIQTILDAKPKHITIFKE